MQQKWKTVRIFISSTFCDMHAERDHLVKVVFPALREKLEKYRIHLIDIDLRWGITEEQSDNDQALDLCLQQVNECRPFFIGILGERYGYVPKRFNANSVSKYGWIQHQTGKSITELEILYGVLQKEEMHNHSFFFFRDPGFFNEVPEAKRTDLEAEDSESAEKLEKLKASIRTADLPVPPLENYPCKYSGLRINRRLAVLDLDKEDQRHLKEVSRDGIVKPEEYKNLNRQVKEIVNHYGVVYLKGLDVFGRHVHDYLWEAIKKELNLTEISPVETLASKDPLAEEEDYNDRFIESRLHVYVGREKVQRQLTEYAESNDTVPCLLTGPSGSGKSAALAKFVDTYKNEHLDVYLIPHFIGASPESTNLRQMLRRFCIKLKERYGFEDEVPHDVHELTSKFLEFIAKVLESSKVLFIIDAINQMKETDNAHTIHWLPRKLPPQVKVIISCIDDPDRTEKILNTFTDRTFKLFRIEALTNEERSEIICQVPSLSAKALDTKQIELLLSNQATENPLFLLVALEELRGFGSFEHLNTRINEFPKEGDSVTAIFIQVIERLEEEFDPNVVRQVLSILACSRNGLSEHELLELIEGIGTTIHHSQSDLFPILRQLRSYLQQRGKLIDFYHWNLHKAIYEHYLSDPESLKNFHQKLANYFNNKLNPTGLSPWSGDYPRGLSELPYHQAHGQMWTELSATLCDLLFVEVKCNSGMLFDLIKDYDRGILLHPNNALTQIRKALKLALPSLLSRPTLAIQSISNRLIWFNDLDPYLLSKLKIVREGLNERGHWISAEAPLPDTYTKSTLNIPYEIKSSIQALSLKDLAIAIGSFDGKVEINDLSTGANLNKRYLNISRIKAIALYDDLYSLAYMDINGSIYSDKTDRSIESRKGETLLTINSNNGILTILPDNSLVEWHPEHNKFNALATALPQPLIVLKNCCDGQRVLFVAGFKHQIIGIARQTDKNWETKIVPYSGPPVTDADLDSKGNRLILASMNRCLRIISTDTHKILAELFYERRRDIIIRGTPKKCTFGISDSNNFVYFATSAGHIASWYIETDHLSRLEDYTSLNESHNLVHFNFISQLDLLFISTEYHGKLITKQGTKELLPRHSAAVTGCFITASDKVISTSTTDRTIRWYSAGGLNPLGQISLSRSQEPTAIARYEDTDNVIVGSSQGLIWNQPCGIEVDGKDIFMALAEPVVSLFSKDRECVLAAGKSGRILRVNLPADKVDVLCRSTGFQKQQKILYAGNAGLFWSVRRDESTGEYFSVVSLVHSENKQDEALKTRHLIQDVAISSDGVTLCIADESVHIFRQRYRGWAEIYKRDVSADHAAFLGNGDMIAVVLRDEPWLEVWKIKEGLPTIAAIDLQGKVSCLSTKENRIVAGFLSGALLSVRLNS